MIRPCTSERLLPDRLLSVLLLALVGAALLAGCGSSNNSPELLEIAGTYTDEFGGHHTITQTTWDSSDATFTFIFHILEFDNDLNFLVALNDSANSFNPGLYSRFMWTYANGNLYYCQDVFDATSETAARYAPFSDAGNLTTGCGGFAWTNLTPP